LIGDGSIWASTEFPFRSERLVVSNIHAYIINLDSARDRWKYVESNFTNIGIPFSRVAGVNGSKLELPLPEYSAVRYRLCHGRRTNLAEVGCYLSHIKCLKEFLASSNDYAVICEDDIKPKNDLKCVLEAAIEYGQSWDILRICGFHNPHSVPYVKLVNDYSLSVTLTRFTGAGAYVLGRRGAEVLAKKLLPMKLPFDHAFDREWFYGLRAASITPRPVDQFRHNFKTQIVRTKFKLPWYVRYLTVFPYQAFNETARVGNRLRQLRRARQFVQRNPQIQDRFSIEPPDEATIIAREYGRATQSNSAAA
jgi:glycosyl transferase, family 25